MCLYARCVLQTDSGQAPNVRFIAVCILLDKQGTVPEDCNHFAHRSVGSEPNGVNHYADKLRYAVRAFLQDAFSLPPAICRYPCLAAVRIFPASKALCTFSKGTNQRWGKNCCQRLSARCLPARSPIRRYPFLAYKRKGRSRDGRKHLFEKYDPKHGLVRAFLSVCNVGNSKKHCCMCFSLSVSAVSFQVSASVGTTPYRQSKFRRSVSVLKTAAPFKCGHFTRYHKTVGFEPTTS